MVGAHGADAIGPCGGERPRARIEARRSRAEAQPSGRAFGKEHPMLGERIGEDTGKVTSQRVLASVNGAPTMETSFQATGSMYGVATTDTATYVATLRPDGTLFGSGQGVLMGKGGEAATWTGQGVGTMKKDGSISYRGACYYQSQSPAWSKLNAIAGVFEYEVDAQGNTRGQLWEWK
jgi:hypothetical protein